MKKTFIYFLFWTLACCHLFAAVPNGYYNSAIGKTERALKSELSDIISANYRSYSYNDLWDIYEESDMTANGKVWDMYSTCIWTYSNDQCGNYGSVCDCYNREHSIPQSWFNERSPMKSDAFHVYPTDGKVNGQRSNYPFGECSGGTSLGGRALGRLGNSTFPGYSGRVFEPDDEYKGDFARTYFYFVTRYEDQMSSFSGESFAPNTYPSLSQWSIDLFLKWHRNDPVSQKEIDRNDAVYGFQRNRNPFIDHPELAEYIWGNKKGQPWGLSSALEDGGISECFHLRHNVVYDQQLELAGKHRSGLYHLQCHGRIDGVRQTGWSRHIGSGLPRRCLHHACQGSRFRNSRPLHCQVRQPFHYYPIGSAFIRMIGALLHFYNFFPYLCRPNYKTKEHITG